MKKILAWLADIQEEESRAAGGKAATLSRLLQAGYQVPPGFVIFAESFQGDRLKEQSRSAVRQALGRLQAGGAQSFAVRSSAAGEDSRRAAFAGAFESILGVREEAEILHAVEEVRASRRSRRVQAYAQASGLDSHQDMAVLIQEMIAAEIAGVLFTIDPVIGGRSRMTGNFTLGPADQLVSGESQGQVFSLDRKSGAYQGPAVMDGYAKELQKLAISVEEFCGFPQDIEWAIAGGKLYLLQSRPITSAVPDEQTGEVWNDSLSGDYLWTSTNFGEAVPEVMTPLTWSMMQVYFQQNRLGIETDDLPVGGNIAGRLYMNISLIATLFYGLGFSRKKVRELASDAFGHIPEDIDIPFLPMTRWQALRLFLPNALRRFRLVQRLKKRVPVFIETAPGRALELRRQIRAAGDRAELLALWQTTLVPVLEETMQMLAAGTSEYKNLSRRLRGLLNGLVGPAEANSLLSGQSSQGEFLASLGPMIGLSRLAAGELSRESYLALYGHRGPSELELAIPTAAEAPEKLAQQLADLGSSPLNPSEMLAGKRRQHQKAWQRFTAQYPRRAPRMKKNLDRLQQASHIREAARSEVVRLLRVLRAYALRAGDLCGLGEDVFFLSVQEIAELLAGGDTPVATIERRRQVHRRYSQLPPYPSLIRGHFDPIEWAADPNRRIDRFDPGSPAPNSAVRTLRGFAGSPGVVEGSVRILTSPEQGAGLQAGEILVANTTNIGWTPLFPRAAAIITDIGAPLSHAAIVARELGLPAVVGTGSATRQLQDGDRVRVLGGQGLVEILE